MNKMKLATFLITLSVIVSAIYPSTVSADEKYISDLKIWISTEKEGPNNSDNIILNVHIFDEAHNLIAELPRLVGPLQVSAKNRQLISFESNAIIGTKEALVFDLNGKLVFSYKHLGFLRDFGITEDQRLYWFHYNIVSDGKPKNIVVILDASGKVIFRDEFTETKRIKFNDDKSIYFIDIPEADSPG